MAAPMRSSAVSQEAPPAHRPRVADSSSTTTNTISSSSNSSTANGVAAPATAASSANSRSSRTSTANTANTPSTAISGTAAAHQNIASSTPTASHLLHSQEHRAELVGAQQPIVNNVVSAAASTVTTTTPQQPSSANFEYDDNEWDIGIGDLIIDLDADIEKTNEGALHHHHHHHSHPQMATNAGAAQASKAAATAKMHIEHSSTTDKGLKMKIKRTKPGTKTSEAKHEIVKSNEQNGNSDQPDGKNSSGGGGSGGGSGGKHNASNTIPSSATPNNQNSSNSGNSKRGSSGHRRDKTRDKHSSSSGNSAEPKTVQNNTKSGSQQQQSQQPPSAVTVNVSEMNGLVRVSAPQMQPRSVFPASTGPGPPPHGTTTGPSPVGPTPSPAAATAQGSAAKPEQSKVTSGSISAQQQNCIEDGSSSPPPSKKMKTESKEVADVCVGTSVGTITEPDCLGPCEPGTSVTLEGIVWHETEGGVLVVNVTWRGKTYVGTLLDCTRHDWAPPRFCDSPTSDLDNRTPKGRETRSSVHSKLRNGGGGAKGRRNGGTGQTTAPSSPTPFIPPRPEPSNKRKSRVGEEEPAQVVANAPTGKKTKVIVPPVLPIPANPPPCGSPPPSPVLLECPEPNCSKKYKHINGLKYHQSHAHGSVTEDDDTKDVTSMSENDESNIEAPSPVTPVKSPEKIENSPLTPQKKDELPSLLRNPTLLDVPSQPATPRSTPPSPATPQSVQDLGQTVVAGSPTVPPSLETKSVVKPGVLRYTAPEDYQVFGGNKTQVAGSPMTSAGPIPSAIRNMSNPSEQSQSVPQPDGNQMQSQPSFSNQLQSQVIMPSQQFTQPPALIMPSQNSQNPPPSPQSPNKISQFKVKPTAALMPEDKNSNKQQSVNGSNQSNSSKVQSFKKKNRKSPAGSPLPAAEQPIFGVEKTGRDDVQSPAYSDISDDNPVNETEDNKQKNPEKKTESAPIPHLNNYGMYHPFYPQHQYLVPQQTAQQPQPQPSQQPQQQQPQDQSKPKEPVDKQSEKITSSDKDGKEKGSEYPQKFLPHPVYQYGYMAGYPSYIESNYGGVSMVQEEKIKEERIKESPSPIEQPVKQPTPIPNPIQVPTPGKVKSEPNLKEKHQNENHQILKESIEIKNQMSPYIYQRQSQQQQQQQQQPPPQQQSHHQQRDEDVRRFYVYNDQRRKEQQQSIPEPHKGSTPSKSSLSQSPSMKLKESKMEEKKDKDIKQEGVKPTMETQGPPPPPTSQYAYIHPGYMQSAHYGAIPFDPNHPVYRGLMVPGPYSNATYLHPQIPRYHAPEDLSRAQPPNKAIDLLQHHPQYYSSHKIHELQERAIKSPTPKTSVASSSPSTNSGQPQGPPPPQMSVPPTSAPNTTPSSGKQTPGDGKDSRSPPPQRHVHTHHHTHVGLGYPMYPAPYGAAVLASQQAAAVTVINPYPTK